MSLDIDHEDIDVQNDDAIEQDDSVDSGESGEFTDEASDATPGESTESDSPFSDEVLNLARSYGWDDDEIMGFETEGALRNAMRTFDKRLTSQFSQSMQGFDQGPIYPQGDQQAQQQHPAQGQLPQGFQADWGEEKDLYDEKIISNIDALAQHFEQRLSGPMQALQQIQQNLQQQYLMNQVNQFESAVDSLNIDGLGSSQKLTPEQNQKRDAVWNSMIALQTAMAAQGMPISITPQLVQRAWMQAFPDEYGKAQQQQILGKVRQQSGRRLGGGTRSGAGKTPWKGDPAQDPELHRLFNELAGD